MMTPEQIKSIEALIEAITADRVGIGVLMRTADEALPALLAAVDPWQPISSAPKDGTPVLLKEGEDIYKGAWDEESASWNAFCGQPVVYTPEPEAWLPQPPQQED